MNKMIIASITKLLLMLFIAISAVFVFRLFFAPAAKFIDISDVDLTQGRVHFIVKTKITNYLFGEARTGERIDYLLDYSLKGQTLKMYGPLSTSTKFRDSGFNSRHQLEMGRDGYDRKRDKLICEFKTIDLSLRNYSWSPLKKCTPGKPSITLASLPANAWGNFDSFTAAYAKLETYAAFGQYEKINQQLRFERPGTDGGFFRVVNTDGSVVAEQKSATKIEVDALGSGLRHFQFDDKAPLSQLHFSSNNSALGLLPDGELLLAFKFTYAAQTSIVLVKWNLIENTSELVGRVFYRDLFSISYFNWNQLSLWEKVKSFPPVTPQPVVNVNKL